MYVEHLQEMPDGRLQPLTSCGRYTGEHIRLNRQALLAWRQIRRQMAQELQVLARVASRLEALLAGEADPVKQSQIREEVEALTARIAVDRRLFL
jgi:hypothetical protein